MEPTAVRNWYDKFAKEGLNFGPSFRSLEEIRNHRRRAVMHTVTKTKFLQGGGVGLQQQSDYIVHPITIDALLQTAIIASTSGVLKNVRAKVPVVIEHASICTPTTSSLSQQWIIDAISEPVGFGTIKISAELRDVNGQVCVQLKQARAVAFQGAAQEETANDRHPMLRVLWKPDVERLWGVGTDALSLYLNRPGITSGPGEVSKKLVRALDLVIHKNPRLHILELNFEHLDVTQNILESLRFNTPFKRCQTYCRGQMSDDMDLLVENMNSVSSLGAGNCPLTKHASGKAFDLVIVPLPDVSYLP